MPQSAEVQAIKLGVMTLAYQREHVFREIAKSINRLRLPVVWQIALNRPNAAVLSTLAQVERDLELMPRCKIQLSYLEAPFSPLDQGRERFMELRQWQLEQLPADCTHAVIWDDDHILEDEAEVRDAIQSGADLTYIRKVFYWDRTDQINTAFPEHNSVFVFRRLPGDSFDLGRTLHAPTRVHDNPRSIVQLDGRLLDFGYLRATDRERCWSEYKRVGKIDAATLPLVSPPRLVTLKGSASDLPNESTEP